MGNGSEVAPLSRRRMLLDVPGQQLVATPERLYSSLSRLTFRDTRSLLFVLLLPRRNRGYENSTPAIAEVQTLLIKTVHHCFAVLIGTVAVDDGAESRTGIISFNFFRFFELTCFATPTALLDYCHSFWLQNH